MVGCGLTLDIYYSLCATCHFLLPFYSIYPVQAWPHLHFLYELHYATPTLYCPHHSAIDVVPLLFDSVLPCSPRLLRCTVWFTAFALHVCYRLPFVWLRLLRCACYLHAAITYCWVVLLRCCCLILFPLPCTFACCSF